MHLINMPIQKNITEISIRLVYGRSDCTTDIRPVFILRKGQPMQDLGLNQLDLFNSTQPKMTVTYQTSRSDIIERETRKLETIAKHHHNSKDPAERAELALQVDKQLDHLKRLEKGL